MHIYIKDEITFWKKYMIFDIWKIKQYTKCITVSALSEWINNFNRQRNYTCIATGVKVLHAISLEYT